MQAPIIALVVALVPTLLLAAPAASQSTAGGQASITIGDVLSLRVEPGVGVAVRSASGEYVELAGAVELAVLANRSWRLEAVRAGAAPRTAGSGVGSPERALWWRVSESTGTLSAVSGYVEAERWAIPVAEGSAGRHRLSLDYRWIAGPGQALEPGVTLHFMLVAD